MTAPRSLALGLTAAMALASAATGCGYHLSGMGRGTGIIPEHVQTFAVSPFENRTNRPEIEQRVTEEVSSLLSRRGRYKVVTDPAQADAILSGAIASYQTNAVQFTTTGRATRVEAVVRIQATLRDRADDKVLWSQSGLIFREQFDVPASGEFFDQETIALDEIAKGAADALINSIFEGF